MNRSAAAALAPSRTPDAAMSLAAATARKPGNRAGLELWLVDLQRASNLLAAIEARSGVLSADDIRRADTMADAALRNERRAAYIALRLLLERRLGEHVRGAAIERTPAGKPSLAGAEIAFSLAHTDGFALVGLGDHGPLGVDIEVARRLAIAEPRRDLMRAAARGLAGAELPAGLAPEPMLLAAWVRIEAVAKARGDGVARLLTALGLIGADRADAPSAAEVELRAGGIVQALGVTVTDIAGVTAAVAAPIGVPVSALVQFPTDWTAWSALAQLRT